MMRDHVTRESRDQGATLRRYIVTSGAIATAKSRAPKFQSEEEEVVGHFWSYRNESIKLFKRYCVTNNLCHIGK